MTTTMQEIYEIISRANTAWAILEDKLRDLFSRTVIRSMCGSMLPHPDAMWIMGAIFHGSTNLRGRVDMMTKIIRRTVKDEALRAEWKSASDRVLKLYKRRNAMAHGTIHSSSDDLPSYVAYTIHSKAEGSLDYRDVKEAEQSFLELANRLEALATAIDRQLSAT